MKRTNRTGIIHVHTEFSRDGGMSVQAIRQLCLARGLSFACITDHAEDLTPSAMLELVSQCKDASDSDFIAVPGLEVRVGRSHLLAIGLTKLPLQSELAALMQELKAEEAFKVLAHPLSLSDQPEPSISAQVDAIEVWNGSYDGGFFPNPAVLAFYSKLAVDNPRLLALGGVDHHNADQHLRVRLILNSESSFRDIISALKRGDYKIHGRFWQLDSKPKFSGSEMPVLRTYYRAYSSIARLLRRPK